jgi:sigma-E factor negative regulatory protein RseC
LVEEGTITKVLGSKALVLVERSSMCDGCHSKSVCKNLGGGKNMEAEANNGAGGKVGDRVLLKIDTSLFLRLTFIVYMIPVLALIAGAIIGVKFGPQYSFNPEFASLVLSVSAFIIAFLVIYVIGKRTKVKQRYMPEIVKIISSGSPI